MDKHIMRLQEGTCTLEMGMLLSELLHDLGRIVNHCSNLAAYQIEYSQDSYDVHAYIESVKKEYPDYTVVAYVNTTALLKTVCDVCVTSSSAVKIVKNIENKNIIFIPDCNLGAYVAEKCPEKNIKLLNGGCPIHANIPYADVQAMKKAHPEAKLLVHPECLPAVSAAADYVGSTAGILDYARKSDAKEFIIGTEISIAEQLAYEFPDKHFYPLSSKLICPDMKATTLIDVYNAVRGLGGEEIILDDEVIRKARVCIDEMIRLGG